MATSGSGSSIEATLFAVEMAAAINATLRILHVIPPIEYRVGRLAPMLALERKLDDPFENCVLRRARELAWRHGVAASLQLLAGDPPQAIVAGAARAAGDVLVIGAANPDRASWHKARRREWIHAHAPCQVLTPSAATRRRRLARHRKLG